MKISCFLMIVNKVVIKSSYKASIFFDRRMNVMASAFAKGCEKRENMKTHDMTLVVFSPQSVRDTLLLCTALYRADSIPYSRANDPKFLLYG